MHCRLGGLAGAIWGYGVAEISWSGINYMRRNKRE